MAIPLHLAVHVLGVAVAAGLAGLGWTRREQFGATWPGVVLGGGLIAASHLLTGAVVVEVATLPLVLRAAGYAGLAVGALGRVVAAPVVLAAPLGVHVAAGIAGGMAAVAAVRGRLRDLGPAALLSMGLGGWALADALGRVLPTPAALLSVLASVAVGAWTIGAVGSGLLARVLAGATALVVVTVLVLSGAGGLVLARDLEQDQLSALQSLGEAQARALGTDEAQDLQSLAAALSGASLATEVETQPDQLDRRAQSLAALPGVDVAAIVGASGTALASWDTQQQVVGSLPPVDEVALAGSALVQQGLLGTAGSGVVTVGERRVLAVGAVPIAPTDEDGVRRLDRIAGVLVLGRSISAQSTLSRVAERTASDAVLLSRGRIAGASDQQLVTPEVNQQLIAVLASTDLPATATVAGESWFIASATVGDQGRLLLLRPDAAGGDLEGEATRTLFVAAVLGLAIAAALAAAGAQRVVGPVQRLTGAAERLAAGEAAEDLPATGDDEVGRLSAAFSSMLAAVAAREQDLAEATDIEAELRRRLEIITGSLTEGLLAVDEHGVVTRANPAAVTLLGVGEVTGRPITKVLRGQDEFGRSMLTSLAGAQGRVVRGTVGPGEVTVAASSAPLLDGRGRSLGRVYLLRDVTGEAQAERMKTEFLANISHELRTPLTPVRGYADLLARREMDHEAVAGIAERIWSAALRLERVIGMLVDYAALEAGRFDVSLAPTAVRSSVAGALEELAATDAAERVQVQVDRQLPPALVDPTLFRRQLVEVIDNACKFSDGPVRVTARRGAGRTLEVVVSDGGPGLPDEVASALGEGFRQGDGSATRRHGGLGLGLAMVRRIATAMGGEVRFEAPTGGGLAVVLQVRAVTP